MTNFTVNKLIYFSILTLFLVACGTQSTPQDTPTSVDTAIPSPTITAAIQPSSTIKPLPAPTSTISPAPTRTHADVAFHNPNPDFYRQSQISPNSEWIAWTARTNIHQEQTTYPNLLVENLNGDKSWLVEFNQYIHDVICSVACFFEPLLWTTDGLFLFVRAYKPYDGPYGSPSQAAALLKLSLKNGEINTILPPSKRDYNLAISPDAEWLVYSFHDPDALKFTFFNLDTHQKQTFSIIYPSDRYWNFYWSPFNQAFIFGVFTYAGQDPIFFVNLQDFSFEQIYHGNLFLIESTEWLSPLEIKFTLPTESVIVNTQTGEITPTD